MLSLPAGRKRDHVSHRTLVRLAYGARFSSQTALKRVIRGRFILSLSALSKIPIGWSKFLYLRTSFTLEYLVQFLSEARKEPYLNTVSEHWKRKLCLVPRA